MRRRKLAFATYAKVPRLHPDDQVLPPLLERRGFDVVARPWSEPIEQWRDDDIIIIRSTWDYYLRAEEFTNWLHALRQLRARVFNPIDVMLWNMNKSYLRDLAARG